MGWRALRVGVALVALSAPVAHAADDGPPKKSRITTFTITPAEPLPPRPRPSVETTSLAPPAPPAPPVPVATPVVGLAPERLIGRWTERDPAYCHEERYVLDWQPGRVRVVLDGRAIDSGAVRYVADQNTLKVERLTDGGEVASFWRIVAVDDTTIAWVETAEKRGDGFTVMARPDKVLVRCPDDAEPAPGFFTRARRWWAAKLDQWWPSTPSESPDAKPTS